MGDGTTGLAGPEARPSREPLAPSLAPRGELPAPRPRGAPDLAGGGGAGAESGSAISPWPAGPAIVAILNVTPDSFSDGGLFLDVLSAVEHGCRMAGEGAAAIDVGGESTRPSGSLYGTGRRAICAAEEIARVVPVVRALRRRVSVPISIDTRKAAVARAALDAGADWINDVSGGTFDPEMLPLVAQRRAPIVLMHMRGTPETMASLSTYSEVVGEVAEELRARVRAALCAGVAPEAIAVDPGLGFAKTPAQSRALLAGLPALVALGHPVMVGASRKSFLVEAPWEIPPARRRAESVAAAVAAARAGARLVRVHDVAATAAALTAAEA